ncbi:hypothetical protein, partial [Campylobacter jejuni]|uniref:hypothetical protein n=1 Tax=Campylobacter jejuni TaxID=197 RepID=UPI001E4AF725
TTNGMNFTDEPKVNKNIIKSIFERSNLCSKTIFICSLILSILFTMIIYSNILKYGNIIGFKFHNTWGNNTSGFMCLEPSNAQSEVHVCISDMGI